MMNNEGRDIDLEEIARQSVNNPKVVKQIMQSIKDDATGNTVDGFVGLEDMIRMRQMKQSGVIDAMQAVG